MKSQDDSERNLFASVATFDAPSSRRALEYLQIGFIDLLEPFLVKKNFAFHVKWLEKSSTDMRVVEAYPLAWAKVPLDKDLQYIAIGVWDDGLRNTGYNPSIAGLTIGFNIGEAHVSSLEFSVKLSAIGRNVPTKLQESLVNWCKSSFIELNSSVGYITVDWVSANVYGSESPYERVIGLSYPWAARGFRQKARGYYWGNLLSSNHMLLLGKDTVANQAPVAKIEALEGEGYYFQLSGDINLIDPARLRKLKVFFAEILPNGFKQDETYYAGLPKFNL